MLALAPVICKRFRERRQDGMSERLDCDVCVIGAGSGGLSVAFVAAQLGARTVLFEQDKMGGECLNTGCVPSKALLAAARAAAEGRASRRLIDQLSPPAAVFSSAMDQVRRAIEAIAPHDSQERFEGLGVNVIRAHAQFAGRDIIRGGNYEVRARRFVIATGSRPATPPIPGLGNVPYLTNETIFSLSARPPHLLIVGGGPIGVEIAQAFARLGSEVTVFDAARLLTNDEPELVEKLRAYLVSERITFRESVKLESVSSNEDGVVVTLEGTGERISGSHLFIAAGRKPNIDGLNLEEAGIEFDAKGIKVNARLRTSNRRVYAIGDASGGPQFTHTANYQAGIVIRSALFGLLAKVDYRAMPWVTYTDPELAHVGMTVRKARERYGENLRILVEDFARNDRALTDNAYLGSLQVIVKPDGTILGASILGTHAGELLQVWALAISNRLKLSAFTRTILPYPTLGEISKTAAQSFYAPKLFSWLPKAIVRFMLKLG
jgi:pyruvate/2-oxoglutarate dehydrogenase complex dihydrolipoamide dehydrogenase (E3) component